MSGQTTTYDLPDDIVEQILCSHCNSYLSCGPVKVQPDGRSICGRCSPPSSDVFARNITFEMAMSKFTFPCRYKAQGCNQRVLFGKAAEHEDTCLYYTFPCPSLPYDNCCRNVSVFDVHKHFEENHIDLLTTNGKFQLDLHHSIQKNLLMAVDGITVIIQYSYDQIRNTMYLDVGHFSNDNEQMIYYKTQIVSGFDEDRSLHFKELQCRSYQSRTVNEQNAASYIMCNYLPALDNPTHIFINVLITVQRKSFPQIQTKPCLELITKGTLALPTSVSQQQVEKHEQAIEKALSLQEKLRCYFCKYYGLPPVYEGCHPKESRRVLACSNCKHLLGNFERKHYEGLTYPCIWRGCTFIGDEFNVVAHTENCGFRNFYCEVGFCEKKYFAWNSLMSHMLGHGTYCPDPSRIVIKLYTDEAFGMFVEKKIFTYFTVLDKKVFVFTCELLGVQKWKLLSPEYNGYSISIHFEHNHCRVKTETALCSSKICFKNYEQQITKMFPVCFKVCNDLEAVIKLQKK